MVRASLVAALAFVIAVPVVRAKCARTMQVPQILTTRDTKLPDGGGVLVGWTNEVYQDAPDKTPADPSDQPTWTAFDGKTKLALIRVALAPGLSVYEVTGKGTAVLKNKAGKTLGTFSHDPKAAANTMTAPAVIDVVTSTEDNERWSERRAVATLKTAPPPAAVAVIVYSVTEKSKLGISFVRLPDTHDKLVKLDVFQDGGHCGSIVDGSRPPTKGEKIFLAYVDAFGRVSPFSATIATK